MKRLSLIFLNLLLLSACSSSLSGPGGVLSHDSDGGGSGFDQPNSGGKSGPSTSGEGGVDVGNMTMAIVPATHASISFPTSWDVQATEKILTLRNQSGSSVRAQRAEIKDLASPSPLSLQLYLNAKYPDRKYEQVSAQGLRGVRADIVSDHSQKRSDIYLVSDRSDFVHIESDLKAQDNAIEVGEQIVMSVRVEYEGVPYPDAKVVTVTVDPSENRGYSFLHDCLSGSEVCAAPAAEEDIFTKFQVGSLLSQDGPDQRWKVGADSGEGRIIELGSAEKVPFESVRVEGKYLVSPSARVPLAEIYSKFTDISISNEKSVLFSESGTEMKQGSVYLLRTVSWPKEDLIVKVRVDQIGNGKPLVFTYQKLVYVDPAELEKKIEAMNEYTRQHEMPNDSGETTIYSRKLMDNYAFAAFNFEYSTSGNEFITNGSWDLIFGVSYVEGFGYSKNGHALFNVGLVTNETCEISDVGTRSLDKLKLEDFPVAGSLKDHCRWSDSLVGHTYLISLDNDHGRSVRAAIQVLEVEPDAKWMRFKFRRLQVIPERLHN